MYSFTCTHDIGQSDAAEFSRRRSNNDGHVQGSHRCQVIKSRFDVSLCEFSPQFAYISSFF